MPRRQEQRALTIVGAGQLRELRSEVRVGPSTLSPQVSPVLTENPVIGIWDTGASGSVITQAVVTQLGLQPITMSVVHHAGGMALSPVYLVDFHLPMGVVAGGLHVTQGNLVPGVDVLIGMDVITMGDFVITNKGGKTKMSFRFPSTWDTDFVEMINRRDHPAPGRAQPPGTRPHAPGRRGRRR